MSSKLGTARRTQGFSLPAWIPALWRPLSSVRLALVVILLIAAATFAGTVVEQMPASVAGDAEARARWLEQAATTYGGFTTLLHHFGLFGVFHSLWYRLLLALLAVSIVVCSLNRWKTIRAAVFGARVRMPPAFFESARLRTELSTRLRAESAARTLNEQLRRTRYRTLVEHGPTTAIYADKNRFARLGTLFTHLGIVLVLAAAFAGALFGETDDAFIIAEGSERQVPFDPDVSLRLERFTEEYYADGTPKDFRSELVVYESGQEVKRETVRVNSPLSYNGLRFHQSFFGPTAEIEVADALGRTLSNESVPFAWQSRDGERPVGYFSLPEQGLRAYVVGQMPGVTDPLVPPGEVRLELYQEDGETPVVMANLPLNEPLELGGLTFTFLRERSFVGLKVVKNPATNAIWAGGGLFVFGLVIALYFPHRRVWALCETGEDGTTRVRLAATSTRDVGVEEEFRRISAQVREALADGEQRTGGKNYV